MDVYVCCTPPPEDEMRVKSHLYTGGLLRRRRQRDMHKVLWTALELAGWQAGICIRHGYDVLLLLQTRRSWRND